LVLGFALAQNLLTEYKVADDDIILYIAFINGFQIFASQTWFYQPVHEVSKFYLEKGTVQANVIQNLTFTWMNDLMAKGYKKQKITDSDIPNPPALLDTKIGYERLKKEWDAQKKKSLFFAMVKVFGLAVLTAVSYEVVDDILSFAQPQLLKLLIRFFNSDDPLIVGILIAFGLFFVSIIETALFNIFSISIYEASLGIKASLMTMIYHKALSLSPESKKNRSTGDILNIMSVDVSRVQDLSSQFQVLVSAPIKLVLCIISLYGLLGKATFAGIIAMVIMIPLNTMLSRRLKGLHKTQMKYKDERTRATSELLSSMKSIKLYAIESAILKKLNYVRNSLELENLKKIGIFSAMMNFSWYCVPFLVSCSSFAIFAIFMDQPLSPDIVFPALALFDILSEPIYAIPALVTSIIEISVSFGRITTFLESEEIDQEMIEYFEKVETMNEVSIEVKNATFLWESSKTEGNSIQSPVIALKIDDFEAKKGEITCIVGKVGSGKSTFLQAILGYLPSVNSEADKEQIMELHGSVAYCSQIPWIMNATVKNNILFGHRFDEEFYEKTLNACQLLPDLEMLPDGDETQVGEKGISLSGGQKARLSLARAVYSRSDIYLLDDILSAVDAHVGKKIINEVITGLLATKTVVLATNSISVLNYATQIILLENGIVVETESPKDFSKEGSKLAALIRDFGFNSEEIVEDSDTLFPLNGRRPSLNTIRRASIETFKKVTLVDKAKRTTQEEEKAATGKVSLRVYKEYAKACSIPGVISFLCLMMLTTTFSISANYWLKNWSENNARDGTNSNVYWYIAIYAFFGIGSGVFTLVRTIVMWVFCAIRGSKKLHDKMALAVVRSPMSFFETTPIGRIINRFSSDINKIDERLPRVFAGFFGSLIKTCFTLGFIGYTMPTFLVIIMFLSVLYIYYQKYYIPTSRDLKRIVNISRSPIFSHLQESLTGVETIRAYKQEDRFQFMHYNNLDFNLKALYLTRSISRWLSVRLQFLGSVIIFAAAILTIFNNLSPGLAGLVISYSLNVTSSLNWIVRMTVEVELNSTSVERVLEYCDLKPEAAELTETRPPKGWPHEGKVKFNNYSAKYRENLDLVLKDINLDIKPGEKVGIVGRTGAGKSTLALAIFRLIEPAGGNISIDGVNTSDLGLHDLRSNLAIIPQDSQAFEGTIRQNLDPLEVYTDEQLWRVLELAHLKGFMETLGEGLSSKLSEGGSNLSVGQRQLLCLARALLNPSKVLILDEATASVDVETDKIVQETIRKEFSDRTILTIAHRIDTVLDSDRIVVLERGHVKEFDTPAKLLENKDGLFYNLCSQGGYIN
jgi:ABC-type multidrug transport system fused ATPase/permease subunit